MVVEQPPVVRLSEVTRRFGAVEALNDVSFDVHAGEVLGIIGRSGAGKSTLIRCLNGLERPDRGLVEVEGQDLTRLSERELQGARRRIGMIFQHFNLLSAKTVSENVALPLKIAGVSRSERGARVAELLDLVGLSGKANAYPAQLSGGQKQRVGIARALSASPALLLSDEATSALDPETTRSILALLSDINRRLGLTIILITHEMEVVRAVADRVIVLERGRIVEQGQVWKVLMDPVTEIARSLAKGMRPELPGPIEQALSPVPRPGHVAVLRLDVHGAQARAPFLADLATTHHLRPVLLQGGVSDLWGEPVAIMFIALDPGEDGEALGRALGFLRPLVSSIQVQGYVPGDL